MQYIAYIVFAFLAYQLLSVMLNVVFHQKVRHSGEENNELVSVLIPARNEEQNIGNLLDSLVRMNSTRLEILVFDDESTDKTAQIVTGYSQVHPAVRLIKSEGLPSGWLGKNHACYQLASEAKGTCFLFIDADVILHDAIISDTVAYLRRHRLGLLSVFPTQILKSFGEKVTVPVMNYILLTLLPLIFVRISPFSSHSAANGQFMLFDAELYKKTEPHRHFRSSAVEDISISRYFKKNKIRIACITGEKRVECRMYSSYRDALNGFSKNIMMFFGNNAVVAFVFWTVSALGFIPVTLSMPEYLTAYIAGIVTVLLLYSVAGRQNPLRNLLLFPLQLVFMIQVMVRSLIVNKQKQSSWKGRNIYS